VAISLLSAEGRDTVGRLLEPVPLDVDIWDGQAWLEGELIELWRTLNKGCWPEPKGGNGMGQTKISKLMATKRPRLVPVYDRVIRELLPPVKDYWAAFRNALSDGELRLQLSIAAQPTDPNGPAAEATFLRKLDAMLWMIGRKSQW
jgi:hypothetical protein